MQALAEKDDVSEVKGQLQEIAEYVLRKYVMTHAVESNGRSMVHATPATLEKAKQHVEALVQGKPDCDRNEALLSESFVGDSKVTRAS